MLGPNDPIDIARVAIGQERLLATPLQMAEVAAAVANGGKLMKPQIWNRVVDPDGRVIDELDPSEFSQPISEETAAELTTAMEGVVSEGTGTNAAIPGDRRSPARPGRRKPPATRACGGGADENQAWFMGFAPGRRTEDRDRGLGRVHGTVRQRRRGADLPRSRRIDPRRRRMTRVSKGRPRVPEVSEGSVVDGRYRVLRKIGSGGMADVWLAEDSHLQRQVALKVLHSRFAQDREFVERFRREAESAAGLHHPNVVAVFDRGEVDGTYYIAMQYLEGRSLKQLIDVGLTPEQAVYLIRQVLEGARFAHRHGVVHRDLKPHNVIVDDEGKAVVTDFGIARAGVSEITQTGSVMGTPALPLARAGPGRRGDPGLRPLLDRRDALRGARRPRPLRRRKRRRGRDETGLAGAAAAELDQPRGLAGARRGRDAGAGEEPGRPLPERRRLHRRARQRAQGGRRAARRHRRLRAAAAGGGSPTPRPPRWTSSKRRSAAAVACSGSWPRVAVLIGVLIAFALTRDTTDRGPESDRHTRSNGPKPARSTKASRSATIQRSARAKREPETVLEQDPIPGEVDEDCAFLSLLLLEAGSRS